jgi:hypothetical protein
MISKGVATLKRINIIKRLANIVKQYSLMNLEECYTIIEEKLI